MLNKKTELPLLLEFHITELLQKYFLPIRLLWHYISFSVETILAKKTKWEFNTILLL